MFISSRDWYRVSIAETDENVERTAGSDTVSIYHVYAVQLVTDKLPEALNRA